jgi:hypothetical protein
VMREQFAEDCGAGATAADDEDGTLEKVIVAEQVMSCVE